MACGEHALLPSLLPLLTRCAIIDTPEHHAVPVYCIVLEREGSWQGRVSIYSALSLICQIQGRWTTCIGHGHCVSYRQGTSQSISQPPADFFVSRTDLPPTPQRALAQARQMQVTDCLRRAYLY